MSEKELQPCPFCGADAEIDAMHAGYIKEGQGSPRYFIVKCSEECNIYVTDKQYAIDNWNERQ